MMYRNVSKALGLPSDEVNSFVSSVGKKLVRESATKMFTTKRFE